MNGQHIFSFIWFIIVGLVAVNLLYHVVKNRGLKGAMFGAPVSRTVGELDFGRKGMVRTRLRVHRLESGEANSPQVGLELITTSFMGFGMRGIPLTREQARSLSGYLSEAMR